MEYGPATGNPHSRQDRPSFPFIGRTQDPELRRRHSRHIFAPAGGGPETVPPARCGYDSGLGAGKAAF